MKVQDLPRRINADDQLVICFDVSKEKLDGYAIHVRSGAADREITVSIDRKADQIEEKLRELSDYADEHGLEGLLARFLREFPPRRSFRPSLRDEAHGEPASSPPVITLCRSAP